jgi:orotate phosphoribosyltransferase
MTTHDKPSDRVESVVGKLEAWGPLVSTGYEVPAAGQSMYEAAKLLRDQQAEIERMVKALGMVIDAKHKESAEAKLWFTKAQEWADANRTLRTRAEQAEAQLAAMQAALEG